MQTNSPFRKRYHCGHPKDAELYIRIMQELTDAQHPVIEFDDQLLNLVEHGTELVVIRSSYFLGSRGRRFSTA